MTTMLELESELVDLLKGVPAFNEASFSLFNLDDFDAKKEGQTLPIAGVYYDGSESVDSTGNPAGSPVHAATMLVVQFVIVIAIQYGYTGQDDTKPQAFNLLDQVRAKVLGYKGVNTRPWRFVGERPEPELSGDGVIFYLQVWQTSLPVIGTFNS